MRWVMGLSLATGCVVWLLAARYQPRGSWRVLPALLAVVCATFGINELRWHQYETQLTTSARPVLDAGTYPMPGERTRFSCERLMRNFWSSQGFAGHVSFDADGTPAKESFLGMDSCSGVKRFRKAPSRAGLEEIQAVHIVAHEAAHLTGERSEARAECLAMAHDAQVMQLLGASPVVAETAALRYRREIHPRLPADYQGTC